LQQKIASQRPGETVGGSQQKRAETSAPGAPSETRQVAAPGPSRRESQVARPWFKKPAGWIILGGGVVLAGVGGGLLGHAADLDSQASRASSLPQERMLVSDRDTFQSAGWALIGVGAAAVVAGAIVFVATAPRRHSSTAQ